MDGELFEDHDLCLAGESDLSGLFAALGRERDYLLVLTNVRDSGCSRDGVANECRRGEPHGLSEIDDLAVAKLIPQHRRDKCAAQHAVRDTLTKPRRAGKFVVEMYRIVIAREVGEVTDKLIRHLARDAPRVTDLDVDMRHKKQRNAGSVPHRLRRQFVRSQTGEVGTNVEKLTHSE